MSEQVTTELVKELRDATGISVMQCRRALEEAAGDMEKALAILKKNSRDIALKKADRALGSGYIYAYVHGEGRIGAMIELMCETDFVAKNEIFKNLAKELCMQVAATNPSNPENLLQEPFIKNEKVTIASLIEEATAQTGEKIEISRLARFELAQK